LSETLPKKSLILTVHLQGHAYKSRPTKAPPHMMANHATTPDANLGVQGERGVKEMRQKY